ncbi:MAG: methionyl-tRNA formyltransferase [Actinomycetota bacterium]
MAGRARVAFLGNDAWSVPSLEALAGRNDLDLALVITAPPRPAGRGARLRSTPVADAAVRLGVALLEADPLGDPQTVEHLRALSADVFVVVAFGRLLTGDLLRMPTRGSINVHFSLLPRWRGASPVQHAILTGDRQTGVTIMRMDEGLDTGPILRSEIVAVGSDENAGSLGERLAEIGAELLADTISDVIAGRIDDMPQAGEPTYAPKLTAADRRLDWEAPAASIVRRVRAFAPDPGATATWRGRVLKVFRAESAPAVPGPPGTIASSTDDVRVSSGSGGVRLLDVAPAGRRRMPAVEWARGARFATDERLV